MPDQNEPVVRKEDPQGIDPRPDPWGSGAANTAQAIGTGAGIASAAVLLNDSTSGSTTDTGSLALLPDPTELFGRTAHLLGFQFNASTAWKLGLVLLVVCVALNLFSLWLRYRYAQQVEAEYAAKLAARAASEEKERKAVAQAKAQGFIGGDA